MKHSLHLSSNMIGILKAYPGLFSSIPSPFANGFRLEAGFLAEDRDRSLFIKDGIAVRVKPENRTGKLLGGSAFPPIPGTNETERLLKSGATLLIKNANYRNRNLNLVSLQMARTFGPNIGCNLYFTPANEKGFPAHSDPHHSIIWQIEGEKEWKFKNQTMTLRPGDVLIIPKGEEHSAAAGTKDSLHATFSITLLNLSDLFEEINPAEFLTSSECATILEKTKLPDSQILQKILMNLRIKNVARSALQEDSFSPLPIDPTKLYSWSNGKFIQIIQDGECIQILSSSKSWWIENLSPSVRETLLSYRSFIPNKLIDEEPQLKPYLDQWNELGLICNT